MSPGGSQDETDNQHRFHDIRPHSFHATNLLFRCMTAIRYPSLPKPLLHFIEIFDQIYIVYSYKVDMFRGDRRFLGLGQVAGPSAAGRSPELRATRSAPDSFSRGLGLMGLRSAFEQ